MKILINQLGRIGDLILITPSFQLLRENFPNAEIYLICGDKNYKAIIDDLNLKDIFVYQKNFLGIFKLLKKLRKFDFDYYFDPKDHNSTESNLLSKIVKAKVKIGNKSNKNKFDFDINELREKSDLHFTSVAIAGAKYIINKSLHSKIKIDRIPKPNLYLNKISENYTKDFLKNNDCNSYILINISASNSNKMWLKDRWISFIEFLIQNDYINKNNKLIICSAASEKKDAEEIIDKININQNKEKEILYFASRSINDIFSIVSNSKLLISPDTSLVHIAASFDIPIVGLYSGNDVFFDKFKPTFNQEVESKSSIVRADKGDDGIHSIELNRVIEALETTINKI
jgi:heptosyltransferase III